MKRVIGLLLIVLALAAGKLLSSSIRSTAGEPLAKLVQ